MSAESPWALPVPTDEEFPPLNVAPPTDGAGAVVALLADEGPRRAGWSARVAVSLAREWARDGLRVFLADGDLDDPALHRVLGEENGEGIGDAIVYGASPSRIGRPVTAGGFVYASAGTVVPNSEAAYDHPRWQALLSAFRESGSVLLLYLPAGRARGVDALAAQADRVVRFSAEAPSTDPGQGHLYIHPAAEVPFTFADDEVPGEAESEGVLTGDEREAPTAEISGDDLADREDWSDPDGETWAGAGELQITDEWAGDGPSSLPANEPYAEGDPSFRAGEAWEAEEAGEVGEARGSDATEGGRESRRGGEEEGEGDRGGSRETRETDSEPPAGITGSVPPEAAPPEAPPSGQTAPFGEAHTGPGARSSAQARAPERPSSAPGDAPRKRPVRARPVDRSLTPWLLALLVILLVAILIASWLGYVTIPGITFAPHPGGAAPSALVLSISPPAG